MREKRQCDTDAIISAGNNGRRYFVFEDRTAQKLFKLNYRTARDLDAVCSRPRAWLRAHYPHLREDYPPATLHCALPPHHLAHARNAGNGYREFCAVVLSPVCRPHDATYSTQLSLLMPTRGHAFGIRVSRVSVGRRNICGNILPLNIASPYNHLRHV